MQLAHALGALYGTLLSCAEGAGARVLACGGCVLLRAVDRRITSSCLRVSRLASWSGPDGGEDAVRVLAYFARMCVN